MVQITPKISVDTDLYERLISFVETMAVRGIGVNKFPEAFLPNAKLDAQWYRDYLATVDGVIKERAKRVLLGTHN